MKRIGYLVAPYVEGACNKKVSNSVGTTVNERVVNWAADQVFTRVHADVYDKVYYQFENARELT